MNSGVYQAIRGSCIQGHRFDIIANNLANAGTTGFKKDRLSFGEVFQEHIRTDLGQGNLRHTGNPLDIALKGNGFFKIKTPHGIRYTRNGNFCLNAEGVLVTQNGDPVLGENGVIRMEGSDITIDTQGEIKGDDVAADTLSVSVFARPERLQKEGSSYYVYKGQQGGVAKPEEVFVRQGYLEESNVVVVEEMTKMIEALRIYESYQKIVQTFDETTYKAINEVGRLQ